MNAQLKLAPAIRQYNHCSFLDYVVNNHRLGEWLDAGDFIPPFGWLTTEQEDHFARMLLLRKQSDLRPGRIPIFVCPECADYGCGVITCSVERIDDSIEWSNFGTENDCEDSLHLAGIDLTLRLTFHFTDYHGVFRRFLNPSTDA